MGQQKSGLNRLRLEGAPAAWRTAEDAKQQLLWQLGEAVHKHANGAWPDTIAALTAQLLRLLPEASAAGVSEALQSLGARAMSECGAVNSLC
jgi:hypothetical protein